MDPSDGQHSNPYHHAEPKLEDEPADEPADEPKDEPIDDLEGDPEDDWEDEIYARRRERLQSPARGPFSKHSGYLGPAYHHRQRETSRAEEDFGSEMQGVEGDTEYETAEEGPEEDFEEEEKEKDIGPVGEDGSELEDRKLKVETSDDTVPIQHLTNEDVYIQARPGQHDVPVEETSEAASIQETEPQPIPDKLTSTNEQPTTGHPAPGESSPNQQRTA